MKQLIISTLILMSFPIFSASFQEIVSLVDQNDSIKAGHSMAEAMKAGAKGKGSWGDPNISLAAVNFPKNSLSLHESMMTGVRLGLSQKVALSNKYGDLTEAELEKSKLLEAQVFDAKRNIISEVWVAAIEKEKILNELKVLNESEKWLEDNLKITKRLYATGKVPQQAVLDIQIKKSELESKIGQKSYQLESIGHRLSVLVGKEELLNIDLATVPWAFLERWNISSDVNDYKKIALEHKLRSSEFELSAKRKDFIPDLTLGFNYTKRSDQLQQEDFVGASISFPLPFGQVKYAGKNEAYFKKASAQKEYDYYLKAKPNNLKRIELEIKDKLKQLEILTSQTIKFAKSSRDIIAKSYSRGGADYIELLRSEFQFQNILTKKINLISEIKKNKLMYLMVNGQELFANNSSIREGKEQ